MTALGLIKVELQQIVESISPIVGAEVAVYDDEFIVIASTVANKHMTPGGKVRGGNVMRHVIKTGQTFVNEHPGQTTVCIDCAIKSECMEYAGVTCPIIFQNDTIGAISFTAFDESQKHKILKTQKELVGFVNKLSILIAGLVAEKELIRQKDLTMQKLETVLSSINDGIIAIDEYGQIINYNKLAIERLGFTIGNDQKLPSEVYIRLNLDSVLNTGKPMLNREVRYNNGTNRIGVMTNTWPIFDSNKVVGAVTVIKDLSEIHSLVNQLTNSNTNYSMDDIITNCPEMISLKKRASRVAQSDSTILITGESGTGKELLSRSIHAASFRASKPFIAINCAAIPDNLLESELFGYEEGAFTGARKMGKPGKLELANGGTLFLDEIGDMPLSLQAKLLRVVEERRIERIGGVGQIQIDMRIIAATNKDLEKLVEEKEFREDLYFRLSVIPLRIPSIRERVEDIPLLLNYYMNKFIVPNSQHKFFSEKALEMLCYYNWPGNVRELRNCVEYALNIQVGDTITHNDLPQRIIRYNHERLEEFNNKTNGMDKNFTTSNVEMPGYSLQAMGNNDILTLMEMEISLIEAALEKYGLNHDGKVNAAQALGIDISTLYRKIKRYNL